MRTTVRLRDDFLERAKKRAAQEGRTLTSLIEKGLRSLAKINYLIFVSGHNRVVPLTVKPVPLEGEFIHLLVGHFLPGRVTVAV